MQKQKEVECPICHGAAVRLKPAGLPWFWACLDKCHKHFRDADGELVPPVACPRCNAAAAMQRYESQQRPGMHYWRCDECGQFFADDDGKPGPAFGDEETAPCPSCDGTAVRRITLDGTETWYWACDGCDGNFADIDGVIGGPIDAMVQ